jgi:hypothetical protein
MLLRGTHAIVLNDSVAFLAKISTGLKSTDIIVAADDGPPSGSFCGIDFGAMAGVSTYMQVVDNITEANRCASHVVEQLGTLQRFNIGGTRCPVRPGLSSNSAGSVPSQDGKPEERYELSLKPEGKASTSPKYPARLEMRMQIRASKTRWRKTGSD